MNNRTKERKLRNRLSALGYHSLSHAFPALRATVSDLCMHCTDEEIARFSHTTYNSVRHQRRAMGRNKYINDFYIRPAA